MSLTAPGALANLDSLPIIGDRFPFSIRISDQRTLARNLESALRTQRRESLEFRHLNQLRSAGRFDRDVIQRWLRAEGYYAATLTTRYEQNRIIHEIVPGAPYRIETLRFDLPPQVSPIDERTLPIRLGSTLRAADVLAAESRLRSHVTENDCLFEVAVSYEAQVDHARQQAHLIYRVAPSPQVRFSQPDITGLTRIDRDFMRNYLTFREGDCFNRRQIEMSRLALLQTNLLARADIRIGTPDDKGEVPVTFDVAERYRRTVRIGLGYDSNTRAGVRLGWEHRNLFGQGERLQINSRFSELKQEVGGEITVPHFGRQHQVLSLFTRLTNEKTEAYDTLRGETGAVLTRPLSRNWSGNAGVSLAFGRVTEGDDKRDDALLSFPVGLDYKRTNDLLNPTRGWALGIKTQPFVDLYNTQTRFLKTTLAASAYVSRQEWWARPTLAMRAATGSISGVSLTSVPSDYRYYVGGGGSVRGYAYQYVGEFNEDDRPEGGLSFGEAALELRLRFSESWGAALFTDGGYAYSGKRPSFGEDFLWGAGLGLRYFTSFAPIRLDLATPLNTRYYSDGRRRDDSVQLYISIGQAF